MGWDGMDNGWWDGMGWIIVDGMGVVWYGMAW